MHALCGHLSDVASSFGVFIGILVHINWPDFVSVCIESDHSKFMQALAVSNYHPRFHDHIYCSVT